MDLGKARDAQLSEREPAVAPFHKHGMKFGNVTGIFSRFAHGPNYFRELPGLDFVETYLVPVNAAG